VRLPLGSIPLLVQWPHFFWPIVLWFTHVALLVSRSELLVGPLLLHHDSVLSDPPPAPSSSSSVSLNYVKSSILLSSLLHRAEPFRKVHPPGFRPPFSPQTLFFHSFLFAAPLCVIGSPTLVISSSVLRVPRFLIGSAQSHSSPHRSFAPCFFLSN